MIYLIDDNQNQQRERLGIDFVDDNSLNGYLIAKDKLEKKPSNETSHLTFMKDAKCILLHASTEDYSFENEMFISGSLTNVEKIKEYIADYGDNIPLVLFSNGMSVTIYNDSKNPNFISSMNKNEFYKNLLDFINHYKNSNCIELNILAYGKNYLMKELLKVSNLLLFELDLLNETDRLEDVSIMDMQIFKTFIEKFYAIDNTVDILNDWKSIKICDFRDKINLIKDSLSKYGKNIYSWK